MTTVDLTGKTAAELLKAKKFFQTSKFAIKVIIAAMQEGKLEYTDDTWSEAHMLLAETIGVLRAINRALRSAS